MDEASERLEGEDEDSGDVHRMADEDAGPERRVDAVEDARDEDEAEDERPGRREDEDEESAPPPGEKTELPLSSARSTPVLLW